MPGAGQLWFRLNHTLAWLHRWAGVALCALIAIWFASGAVLHFVPFPSLNDRDRWKHAEPIDPSRLRVSPAQALLGTTDATGLRLVSVAGRPEYILSSASKGLVAVAGDSGERLPLLSVNTARQVATEFGAVAATAILGPFDYDQWVVHQRFDPYRPFYRVRLRDDSHSDLYVSARTGEVLQQTHRSERLWNWCGAVIHWIYFTPLRHSWSAWNQTVWWLSLAALLTSAAGVWLGIVRFSSNRAAGRRGLSPYRGWMRWHHIAGLFSSVFVVSWILSGWLSMDHGRLFSHGDASAGQIEALRGLSVAQIAQSASLEALRSAGSSAEINFNALAGNAFLTARETRTGSAHLIPLNWDSKQSISALPEAMLLAGLDRVWPKVAKTAVRTDDHDALYRLAESTRDGAAGFEIAAPVPMRVYLDPSSGRFLAVMDSSRRSYAWIYYALHTFQFPGLIAHPTLRTATVLILLGLGFLFSVTGVVIGINRLKHSL